MWCVSLNMCGVCHSTCPACCLMTGGYAVLKGLKQAMQLPVEKMIPSFATLRDYGNTSCSTTW